MDLKSMRKRLYFYQRMMITAKTAGNDHAHEMYKQLTRELIEQIRKEETARGERTA